jgi:hypothetical protein
MRRHHAAVLLTSAVSGGLFCSLVTLGHLKSASSTDFFVEISQKLAASPDAIGSVVRGPMGCGSAFDWIGMREMNKQ